MITSINGLSNTPIQDNTIQKENIPKDTKDDEKAKIEALWYGPVGKSIKEIIDIDENEDNWVAKTISKIDNMLSKRYNTEQDRNAMSMKQPKTLEEALQVEAQGGTVEAVINEGIATIGEKLSLRRFEVVSKTDSDAFGAYSHMGGRIGVLTLVEGSTDEEAAKDVAMHIAALAPRYLDESEVPADVLEHEKKVLTEQALNEGKPANIVEKMIVGRINKFLEEITVVKQKFVKDDSLTVEKFVASKGGKLAKFVRYEVGEGIEKREDNFAEEVMSQVNASK